MKLYKTKLELCVYFTVSDDEDTRIAAWDAMRDALFDAGTLDCEAEEVQAGEVPDIGYDGTEADLVYGSHEGDLSLGEALAMIPGHAEARAAFASRMEKARSKAKGSK